MKPADPTAEDMFEKARKAFFETANARPKANASSAESLVPTANPHNKSGIVAMASSSDEK